MISNDSEKSTPTTVMDYAAAVESLSSGQFTRRFTESGRKFFASLYGAPFFAVARLAPELLQSTKISLLIADPTGSFAADGGRWLSLYAKAQKSPGKFACTVCAAARPNPIKPPKPLLFQPPQQVLVKSWSKHLRDLDAPPDITILYVPDGFHEIQAMGKALCQLSKGRKALLACHSRAEIIIVRFLLQLRGCLISDVLGFKLSDSAPQDFATGAWWISAIPPVEELPDSVAEKDVNLIQSAYQRFRISTDRAKSREEVGQIAAAYATRSIEVAGEESISTVRISPTSGIDLATGRIFSINENPTDKVISWEERTLSPGFLALAPEEDTRLPPDGDRLSLMFWLGSAMKEEMLQQPEIASGDMRITRHETNPPKDSGLNAKPSKTVETPQTSAVSAIGNTTSNAEESTAQPQRSRLPRSAGTVNVLALAAMLGKAGQSADRVFDTARTRILAWLGSKGFAIANPLDNSHIELPDGELSIETDGLHTWAMRFDDRRSMEKGVIWRVETTLLGLPEPAISLRLIQVRSNEEAPPPVASGMPQIMVAIASEVGLEDAGVALLDSAVRLSGSENSQWLTRLLINPNRTQPVIVIAGKVGASAERLAARMVGVAHVVCINSPVSNRLIRDFGRDLSVFGHAVRLYRPGFTTASDPRLHPIWALNGTQLPKWLTTDIFEEVCAISLEVDDLDNRAPSFQWVRNHLIEQRLAASEQRLSALRQKAENIASSKDEQIGRLQAICHELESALADYKARNDALEKQINNLKNELQPVRDERDAALEEARQLRYQLSNQWTNDATEEKQLEIDSDDSYYPDNWDELEEWVEIYGEKKLVLHPQAAKAARKSPFKDIPFAYKAMEYLVQHYIPTRTRNEDDTDIYQKNKQALAELGLEESDAGTAQDIKRYKKEYRRIYEGNEITLDRHLKRGVGFGRDHQFRLYFYYDADTEKVVIGHMPTHLTNRLSHNG